MIFSWFETEHVTHLSSSNRILLQRRNLVGEVERKQEAEGRKRWSISSLKIISVFCFYYFCGSLSFVPLCPTLNPVFSVMLQKASSDSDSNSGSGSEKKVVDSESEDEKPRPALSGSESHSGSKSESDSDPPPPKGPQARKKGVNSVLFKIGFI